MAEEALEALLDFDEDLDTPDPEDSPVSADDIDQADRWLRGLAAVRRRRSRFVEVADRRRAELNARVAEIVGPMDAQEERLERVLQQFHVAVLARSPASTTVKLPSGELTARAGGVEWVIEDEEALRSWLKDHMPVVLEPQEPPAAKLNRATLKERLKDGAVVDQKKGGQVPLIEDGTVVSPDGEAVPGLRIVAKPRTYTPKVG
jgi:hypothetical protein